MIQRHAPEPRLEPPHYEDTDDEPIIITDEDIEEKERMYKCGVSDETLNEIYRRLGL